MPIKKPSKKEVIQVHDEVNDIWYTSRVQDLLSIMFTCAPVRGAAKRALGKHMFLFYKDFGVSWKWLNENSSSYGAVNDAYPSSKARHQHEQLWQEGYKAQVEEFDK